jgi:type IV secretion system protein VirB4
MSDFLEFGKTEREARDVLPYIRHVADDVISLAGGGLMMMFAVEGLSFQSADTRDLNGLQNRLNTLWRNIADPALSVYVMTLRRRSQEYPDGVFGNGFAAALDAKYRQRLSGETLYRNDLFVALVRAAGSDTAKKAGTFVDQLKSLVTKQAPKPETVDGAALKNLRNAALNVAASLAPLGARKLGLEERGELLFSEMSLVLHRLLGGRMPRVPLTMGTVRSAVLMDRPVVGKETVEIRYPGATGYVGMLALKEYPARTYPGLLNELLALDMELSVVQSFRFLDKASSRELLGRQQNRMANSSDKAFSQVAELDHALDDLESNRWVLGDHHASVAVFADGLAKLDDSIARARNAMASGGAVVVREDLGLEATWWAQMPGNLGYRCRSASITSANFSDLAPLHSYPLGQATGNAWGDAVALLKTDAGSPYYFNFHAQDVGNTLMIGPSGSGKTVALNFLLAQLLKHKPRLVCFDKDRGAELFIRACGGTYLALKTGLPTGFAPLKAIAYDERGQAFLCQLMASLAGRELTVEERENLAGAVATLGESPLEMRTMGTLRVYLGNNSDDTDTLSRRLKRWEAGEPLGWVFDNVVDEVPVGVEFSGYDMTDFLDHPEIRSPLMMYLFRRIEDMIDGRRIAIVIDEFWKALEDEQFKVLILDKLKTIRKQNGLLIFATQSPADALRSSIAHAIIEQCPTRIFFPNGRADARDYVDGMKLTAREFDLIATQLTPESRMFLVKQNGSSVVAGLDLHGFDEELAVLSGRTANIELLESIRAEVGDDPAKWLDVFHQRRRAA